jgi:hypothetical protein
MAAIKITNPKLSPALVQELEDEPAYQNIKAYAATHTFLRKVLFFCRDQEYASIPAKKIKEWFETHAINYKTCLNALEHHGLIKIKHQYIVGAKTRRYKLTEKGAGLMFEGQMQYLKKLFADPGLRRKLQKQQSYHRNKADKYKDPFLQHIHTGLIGYTFDEAAVKLIEESDWGSLTKLKAVMNLTDFVERDFVDLKHNDTDNRCWNEFVGMKSELRKYFRLGNLKYRYILDIRSCHPLFLAYYLVYESEPRRTPVHPDLSTAETWLKMRLKREEREQRERFSNTNPTTINPSSLTPSIPSNTTTTTSITNTNLHYVGGNSDIQAELWRWNQLFSDPDTDPKSILIRDLGYTRDQAKAALNQSINGGKQYRRFIKWFKAHFPLLHAIWDRTYKKKVGVDVSAYYETVLMKDMGLYTLADGLGLHLTYEFDGCGVMCRDDDSEVLAKIQQLIQHIQAKSVRSWGIRPVIVVKTAAGEVVDLRSQIQNNETERAERPTITPQQPDATPATHTAASASRRSSSRSARPGRKPRGSLRPSTT